MEWLASSFLRFLMYVQNFLFLNENVTFSSSDEIREFIRILLVGFSYF